MSTTISKPTFGGVTIPFPSEAIIIPIWVSAENLTLGGKTRKDVMARKYQYTLSWDYMNTTDYDNLEAITNALAAATFIYDKWPKSTSPGVSCIGTLSARKLESGSGTEFWSSVKLVLIEVDSRI